MFDILFLGTGASVPSRDKSLPSVAVRCGSEITLFDCGEGTQRQLMISSFSFMKVSQIFITHMHGDHTLGLPGLLQTMGMSGKRSNMLVCGPKGIRDSLTKMLEACEGELEFPIEIREISDGDVVEFKGYSVTAFETQHGTPSLGFLFKEDDRPGRFNKTKAASLGLEPGPDFTRLQNGETVKGVAPDMVIGKSRKGCSLVYTGDTVPCDNIRKAAKNVDVLIHESTYIEKESKLAAEHNHSTAKQAAETAAECGVRKLFLIHVSNRYGDTGPVLNEAKAVFEESVLPSDFEMYTVLHGEIRSA